MATKLTETGVDKVQPNVVGVEELNISGVGNNSQFMRSNGDGTISWVTPPTNTGPQGPVGSPGSQGATGPAGSSVTVSGSLASSGYQKLSSGFIIQWGSSYGNATISFPLTFPTACRSVQCTGYFNGADYAFTVPTIGTSSFYSQHWGSSTGWSWIAVGY